jgi:hypothetical protein
MNETYRAGLVHGALASMIRQGQRSRLALSNRAIAAYQRFRLSAATASYSRQAALVVAEKIDQGYVPQTAAPVTML